MRREAIREWIGPFLGDREMHSHRMAEKLICSQESVRQGTPYSTFLLASRQL